MLTTAAATVGGIAVGATAVPFVSSLRPSARAEIAAEDVQVDISDLRPGELRIVAWRGLPVWILRRTPEMLQDIQALENRLRDPTSETQSQQPEYARNWHRSIKPEVFVAVGICTHLGCSPRFKPEHAIPEVGDWWRGGFLCPCHFSEYDLAGRVFQGISPAPMNLPIPAHHYVSDTEIVIGDKAEHT